MTAVYPLHSAVLANDIPRMLEILGAGPAAAACANTRDAYGMAPIHYVRSARAARVLLGAGAHVDTRTSYGSTPLHVIIRCTHYSEMSVEEIVALISVLMDAGASLNAKEVYTNSTALQIMVNHYSGSVMRNRARIVQFVAARMIQRGWKRYRSRRRNRAALCIQACWERCAYDRRYALCRRRLEASYAALQA